ncbi:MAG TPA: 50S ribosomal protein L24 [Candidatus Norongarragalinales archaeon]|jgi:ribosomal protein uL24|nr:50S ribosomal protein L24 [Candidatus Norongarragalinales archaeon]
MKFSKLVSKQPRKKRLALYNLPIHLRTRNVSAHLSKELRKSTKKRSVRVRPGDKIIVVSGDFKKKQGKILSVDTKRAKVYIEGIMVKKQSKQSKVKEALVAIPASNVVVLELAERK